MRLITALTLLCLSACYPVVTSSDGGIVSNPGTTTCASNSDCPNGQECEIEEEHGTTTSFCKPHGGNDGGR